MCGLSGHINRGREQTERISFGSQCFEKKEGNISFRTFLHLYRGINRIHRTPGIVWIQRKQKKHKSKCTTLLLPVSNTDYYNLYGRTEETFYS